MHFSQIRLRASPKRGLTLSGKAQKPMKSICLQRVRPLIGEALSAFAPRSGLSSIDLILAVMLMGLAAALTAPKLSSNYQRHQLRAVIASIAADITYLRRQAAITGREVSMEYDRSTNMIRSSDAVDPERPGSTFTDPLGILAHGIKIEPIDFPGGAIRFAPRGETWFGQKPLSSWGFNVSLGRLSGRVLVTPDDILQEVD